MKILATVNYGKAQITQSWKLLESEPCDYIVLHEADDGKIVIPLDNSLVKDMSPDIVSPKKVYKGTLSASEAVNLKSDSN